MFFVSYIYSTSSSNQLLTRDLTMAPTSDPSREQPKNQKHANRRSDRICPFENERSQCDYLAYSKNKLTCILICLSLILTDQMSTDIEEATIEEALLRTNEDAVPYLAAFIGTLSNACGVKEYDSSGLLLFKERAVRSC